MDLGRKMGTTGRKITKYEAQKWWARNSVRSAKAFETVWSQGGTISGFLHEADFGGFVQLLLEPTAEDLRTVKQVLQEFALGKRNKPNLFHDDRPMGGLPLNAPIRPRGFDGVQAWWTHRMTHREAPLGKNELRSLLDDENRLTSWFEEQADGAGPAEQKYVDEAQESAQKETGATSAQNRMSNALWKSVSSPGEEEEEDKGAMLSIFGDDETSEVNVDMPGMETSVFDSCLATFRSLHDYYNMDVPDPSERWRNFWNNRNLRFTTIRASPHNTTMFDRESIQTALRNVLEIDEDLIQTLWAELDTDGSGVVDRDEAMHWWEENLPSHNQMRFDLAWTMADKVTSASSRQL